ncbi:MAG: fatty acid desaturase [Anaerolineales bacterium]|nr:fatty acid desaturase [Anaerolineales bacterium]
MSATDQDKQRVNWHRTPLPREVLAALNQRSDLLGWLQTLGHLGLLALTGGLAWYALGRAPWWVLLLLVFVHGTCYAFLINAFHEFVHQSVFKTRALNDIFLNVVSFLGWANPVAFWASHQEHHKFTLHQPYDLEVVLPQEVKLASFLKSSFVNPWDFWHRLKLMGRHALGRVEGTWESYLFPPEAVAARRALFTWARVILLGHAAIVVVSLALGWWMVPIVVTLAPFYGGCLQFLCNNTQHVGLQDAVSDYRLCTRSFLTNPIVQFLYWHMNYHIEHHMYAAVPCYHLGKLHRAIAHDLPPTPVGLWATWREILAILKRQHADPTYAYVAPLPAPRAALD